MLTENNVYHQDCLIGMHEIPDGAVDLILCDLPYGVTARQQWDVVIPLEPLWEQYKRVAKENAAIVLTATMPFAIQLINSNPEMFRYELIWQKNKVGGFLNANRRPLTTHELVTIFYRKQPTYNPQKTTGHPPVHAFTKHASDGNNYGKTKTGWSGGGSTERHPTSILKFPVINNDNPEKQHPAQKPLELIEFLIKSYSNPDDLVLDNACGSGTTLVAAKNTGRRFIGFEIDEDFYKVCRKRLDMADI